MRLILALWLVAAFASCNENKAENRIVVSEQLSVYQPEKPDHFPGFKNPEDNPLSVEKIELGERLFFDPILSSDTSISCSSCHLPQFAFSDTVALSKGVDNRTGNRNAPSLMNLAYASALFKDGGAPSLEMQMITPIEDENEMNLDVDEAVERLKQSPVYSKLFKDVFKKEPSLFGLTRAIAAYERTLFSGNSTYDAFLKTKDSSVFSTTEWKGYQLFTGNKLKCIECHNGFNLTNNRYENNGLYANYMDYGRADITLDSTNIGQFRV